MGSAQLRSTALAVAVVLFAAGVVQIQNPAAAAIKWIAQPFRRPSIDPARGYFPKGCHWRTVRPKHPQPFWGVQQYEYWDGAAQAWSTVQPAACRLQLPGPQEPMTWPNNSRTGIHCTEHHCILNNLWYNSGQFYSLTDDKGGAVGCRSITCISRPPFGSRS